MFGNSFDFATEVILGEPKKTERTKISVFKNCDICKQFAVKHSLFRLSIQNEAFIT